MAFEPPGLSRSVNKKVKLNRYLSLWSALCQRTPEFLTLLDSDLSFLDRAVRVGGVYLDYETCRFSRAVVRRGHHPQRIQSHQSPGQTR